MQKSVLLGYHNFDARNTIDLILNRKFATSIKLSIGALIEQKNVVSSEKWKLGIRQKSNHRNMRKTEAVRSCFFGRFQICCYLELESDG